MEATNNNVANVEEGLDELLDSCLDDFNRPLPKSVSSNLQPGPASTSTTKNESKDPIADAKLSEASNWGEEFKNFQDVMENFLESESEISELKNLMSNFNENGVAGLDNTFLETIKGLTEGAQHIPEMSPEELAGLFNFDLNESNQAEGDQLPELMPLMHNVMQRLMSKELLYPSLKEIVDKYPDWLSEKKSSLKPQEYEQYNQQYNLMKSVCDEFERETDDSEEAKKESFEKVLMLMQKIQNYGNPPKELVADMGQNIPLDEHGNLQIPGMPQQCSVM